MLLKCLWLPLSDCYLLYKSYCRDSQNISYIYIYKKNISMTKNRASDICGPSLEEMLLIPNISLLWHHGVLLNSELWTVWKELYPFIKRRPAFHSICQALCWVCSFFSVTEVQHVNIMTAGCQAMPWMCWHSMVWIMLGVCDEVSLIMGGLHSSCLCCIFLHVSTINFLGAQDLNN